RHTRFSRDWSSDVCSSDLEFQATGEVLSTRGTSVAFNDDRILGPEINLTRRTDGSWAGTINDTLVDIRVKEGNLHGIHIDLHWKIGRASCRERVYIERG